MHLSAGLIAPLLAGLGAAAPATSAPSAAAAGTTFLVARGSPGNLNTPVADLIAAISPASTSCDNAPAAGECATNTQAAPFMIKAMTQYALYTPGGIAAVLAWILFESGDLKYNKNHFPGRPGQGTRDMQMANFNLLYAQSVPALRSQLPAGATTTTGMSDDQLNQILDLVGQDDYSFASGAWFLSTQCDKSVLDQLASSPDAGFQAYMTSCVGVTLTDDRTAYWERAKTAFGIASS